MKRKFYIVGVLFLLSLGLSACGKKEVIEEPPYSLNGLTIGAIPTDITSEVLPDIVDEDVVEESTIVDITTIESSLEESTIMEEPIMEEQNKDNVTTNEIDSLINNYWVCDALGIIFYFEEDSFSAISNGLSFDGEYIFKDNTLTIDGEDAKVLFMDDIMVLTADGFGFEFKKGTKEDWDEEVGMPFDYESEFVGMTLNDFIATGVEFDEGYTGVGNTYLFEARNPKTEEAYEFIMSGEEVAAKLDEKDLTESIVDYLGDFPINAIRIYTKEEYLKCKLDLSVYKDKIVNDLYLDGFSDFQVEAVDGEENRYIFKAWDSNFNFYSRPVIITLDESAQPIMDKYSGFIEQEELFQNLKDFTILDIVYEEDLEAIDE